MWYVSIKNAGQNETTVYAETRSKAIERAAVRIIFKGHASVPDVVRFAMAVANIRDSYHKTASGYALSVWQDMSAKMID